MFIGKIDLTALLETVWIDFKDDLDNYDDDNVNRKDVSIF